MRKVRVFSTDLLRRCQRLFDIEVGRVRTAEPQGIQHENAHTAQFRDHVTGQELGVRYIPQATYAQSERGCIAVRYRERLHRESRCAYGLISIIGKETELGSCGACVRPHLRVEDVAEPAFHSLYHVDAGVQRDGPVASREDTQVVNTMRVVSMLVRVPHGIDAIRLGIEQLLSQIGWRVDQQAPAVIPGEQCGMPCPSVPRIRRCADITTAADDGHTKRGARPEEPKLHSSSTRSILVVPATWNGIPAVTMKRCPSCARRSDRMYVFAQLTMVS